MHPYFKMLCVINRDNFYLIIKKTGNCPQIQDLKKGTHFVSMWATKGLKFLVTYCNIKFCQPNCRITKYKFKYRIIKLQKQFLYDYKVSIGMKLWFFLIVLSHCFSHRRYKKSLSEKVHYDSVNIDKAFFVEQFILEYKQHFINCPGFMYELMWLSSSS